MSSPSSSSLHAPAVSESSSVGSAPFASCPLLRSLRNDGDIQFELLRFLVLNEIGILSQSHRLWGVWLSADRALSKRHREVRPSRFALLLACPWALRAIDHLSFQSEFVEDDVNEEKPSPQNVQATEDLREALVATAQHNAHTLILLEFTVSRAPLDVDWFERCISPLVKLQALLVTLPDDGDADAAAHQLLRALSALPLLTELRLLGLFDQPALVDLSVLPSLPALQRLEIFSRNYSYEATAAQLDCISRCLALTALGLGNWCPESIQPRAVDQHKSIEERLEAGIGCLVKRQLRSNASAGTASALSVIEWFRTRMTSALWRHVSQLTTLESLYLVSWSADMSADQWAQLPAFTRLLMISIYPDEMEQDGVTSVLKIEQFLPALVQCKTIESLHLGTGLRLTAAHLETIARGLPKLSGMTLFATRVESLLPLLHAPSLTVLWIDRCTGLAAEPVQFRVGFPALLLLQKLEIEDRADFTDTPEELAVLNTRLRSACPNLTEFVELVAEVDEDSDDEEDDNDEDHQDEEQEDDEDDEQEAQEEDEPEEPGAEPVDN